MKTLGVLVVAASTTVSAFQTTTTSPLASTTTRTTRILQPLKAVTIEQAEQLSSQKEENPFQIDMTGVKFSVSRQFRFFFFNLWSVDSFLFSSFLHSCLIID